MTALPPEVARWLESRHGAVRVEGAVGGGCIHPAVRLRLGAGAAFLKFNPSAPAGMFPAEADGLRALRSVAPALRVPEVIDVWEAEPGGGGAACLLLEWLETARPDGDFWERLGHGLAEMHRPCGGTWGWKADGFIGPLPQANTPMAEWPEFWHVHRLEPRLRGTRAAGWRVGREGEWEELWRRLPEILAPAADDGPSLLHGDLWSGNVLASAGAAGVEPALIDPAVYRGHREVDLAMADLFGGFAPAFHAAYAEAWPLAPGHAARRALYQLFPLLVHVELFGAGYVRRAEAALRAALAA